MKILHSSDLHFGISLCEHSLYDEQLFMVNSLIKIAKENQIDSAIFSGDIFDRAIVPQHALFLYDMLVTKLCDELKIPTFICAGNHDAPERLALCSKMLAGSGLFIEGKLKRDIKPIIINNCSFYIIPYFNTEAVRQLFPECEIPDYQFAFNLA